MEACVRKILWPGCQVKRLACPPVRHGLASTAGMETQNQTAPRKGKTSDSKLREFFVLELKDILWAEKAIVTTLPKMQAAATSSELQEAFRAHTVQSQQQVTRLEQVFSLLGESPEAIKCEAMAGIIEEGKGIIEETEAGTATRDVGLVVAAQTVEHYEIATYGALAQLARTLGETEAAELLAMTLEEEKDTDLLLTDIAESSINYEAAEEAA